MFSGVFVEEYKIYIILKPPCLLHGTPLNNIEKLILLEKEGKSKVCAKRKKIINEKPPWLVFEILQLKVLLSGPPWHDSGELHW